MKFDGETFEPERDEQRLTPQFEAVRDIMFDAEWHTIYGLATELKAQGIPASDPAVSARIRDLRKPKFGGFNVERRYVANGVWEYCLTNPPVKVEELTQEPQELVEASL